MMGGDPDLLGLAGKNYLVIGGGQGMGESTSLLLARAGANVAVVDVETTRAEAVATSVRSIGTKSFVVTADVLDDNELLNGIHEANQDLGGLDGVVTIVGAASWTPLLDMDPAVWDLDHRRNLRYFFLAARETACLLIKQGKSGSIVGITSVDGIQSAPYHGAYGAAKAGLVNLVRSMAAEWSQYGVRVNAIAPGAIVTPRIPLGTNEAEAAQMGHIPMQKRGTTDDIGKGVLFMLSGLSNYVTGQTLAVDGGYTAVGPMDYSGVLSKVSGGGTLGVNEAAS